MAKSRVSRVQPSPQIWDIGDLFENVSINKRSMRGKHVAIKAIRIGSGRLEADYEINGGRASTKGTLLIQISGDEALEKLSDQLSNYIVQTYKEFEKIA